jgi:lipopolysaccharide export system permease protein
LNLPAGTRGRTGLTIERYVLALTAKPFFGTLLILLPALLLERLLRLFALVASNSVPAGSVGRMLLDLVPHYLGLALPIALFIGVHAVIAQLSAENELDAMQNAGLSLGWISRPLLLLGLIAAFGGFGLYGYGEPLARYAYRAAMQEATQGSWDAIIPAGAMTQISNDLAVTADKSDRYGDLRRIFLYQRHPDGSETVITSREANLALIPHNNQLVLEMAQSIRLDIDAQGGLETLASSSNVTQHTSLMQIASFPPRGENEDEMTLDELLAVRQQRPPSQTPRSLEAELHTRIIRALSLAVVPFLGVPFGLAAKRARRGYGIVLGVIILVLYYHAVELAGALGSAGLADPRPLLWGAFLLFAGFSFFMFWQANRHSHAGPLDRVFLAFDGLIDGARQWLRRREAKS